MTNLGFRITLLCLAIVLVPSFTQAQPPNRPGQPRGPGGGGPGMGGPGAQQTPPLLRVFDINGDNELSADEIDNAANALRKLDRDRDGRLSANELRPAGRGGDPAQADAAFAAEILSLDENKDGAISLDELPQHMHAAFGIADADRGGSLDQAERLVLASQFRRDRLPPSGENMERQDAPTAGR